MGLPASIFKSPHGNFSNGGISSKAVEVLLVNVPGPFEPDEKHPAAMIVEGAYPGIAVVVPAVEYEGEWFPARSDSLIGPMMGGSYVSCSDSRFVEAVEKITGQRFYGAVALHDRFESPAQYASYD